MATTLIICPGASAKTYALFSGDACVLEMRYTCYANECTVESWIAVGWGETCVMSLEDFDGAFAHVLEKVQSTIESSRLEKVSQVVIKVTVPGTYFQTHREITSSYITELKQKEKIAVRQVRPILQELTQCQSLLSNVALYAASDSDFHSSLPTQAREYSLSSEFTKKHDVYKFGVHGLCCSSVVERIHAVIGIDPKRMIICHIGKNISVTTVKDGESVDTNVGFVTESHAGDLDLSAGLQIMKSKNLRPTELETFVHSQGGLHAFADIDDVFRLLEKVSRKDAAAVKALDAYVYHIQKAIAAATVATQGIDALVFSGMYGVRSPEIRAAVLERLSHLQIQVSEERNNMMIGKDGVISQRNSLVKVVVIQGDEFSEMNTAIKKIKLRLDTKNNRS